MIDRRHRTAIVAALLPVGLGLLTGCPGAPQGGRPAEETVVLRVAGFSVNEKELNRYVKYLERWDPILAKGKIRRYLIDELLLPAKIVRSLVAAEDIDAARRRAEDLATAVAAAGGTVKALERFGAKSDAQTYVIMPLNDVAPDVGEVAFSLPVGHASAAIHTVYGSLVLGVMAVLPQPPDGRPARRIYSVYFPYSSRQDLRTEVSLRLQAMSRQVAEVHPRYLGDFESSFEETRPLENR